MTYFQMGDDHLARLEESGLSNDAILLEVQAFNHAAKSSSDGYIRTRLAKLIDSPDPALLAAELVAQGFWEVTDDGYYCVNYLQHNLSSDMVDMAREGARERKERSRRHKLGDHSMCIRGDYCKNGEVEPKTRSTNPQVTRDGTRDGTRDRTPRQDNTKQDNSRSVSIVSKDGSTPDAPNGALVVSPLMSEWPHPYLFGATPTCLICNKEKSTKHIDTDLTSDVHVLLEWLSRDSGTVQISHEVNPIRNEIQFVLTRFNAKRREQFKTNWRNTDDLKKQRIDFDYFIGDRVISREFGQMLNDSDTERIGESPIFDEWMQEIVEPLEHVKWIDVSQGLGQETLAALWGDEHEHWITGENCEVISVYIYGNGSDQIIGARFYIQQMMAKLVKKPEPNQTEPIESNEMEKQQ